MGSWIKALGAGVGLCCGQLCDLERIFFNSAGPWFSSLVK